MLVLVVRGDHARAFPCGSLGAADVHPPLGTGISTSTGNNTKTRRKGNIIICITASTSINDAGIINTILLLIVINIHMQNLNNIIQTNDINRNHTIINNKNNYHTTIINHNINNMCIIIIINHCGMYKINVIHNVNTNILLSI